MKIWQVVAVSVAAGVTLPALAQMAEGPVTRAEVEARVKDRLGKLDTNKDGTISRDEIMATVDARLKARADDNFAAMDTDKNGSISRSEYDAWMKDRKFLNMPRVEHYGGPNGKPWPEARREPLAPNATPQPAPGPDGKLVLRERMRVKMLGGNDVTVMADGDGKGIVIADAVKKALERFDAADTNKDGKLTPEERKAQRGAWRMKVGPA